MKYHIEAEVYDTIVGLIDICNTMGVTGKHLFKARDIIAECDKVLVMDGESIYPTIFRLVCRRYTLSPDQLLGKSRDGKLVKARFISMWLAREYTKDTTTEIGNVFNRDHSTVVHALKSVKNWIQTGDKYGDEAKELEEKLIKSIVNDRA